MAKSRNLSAVDFLECLEEEYVCAQIRAKIYPNKNDKDYFKQVQERKKVKIQDISDRNDLPNIFTDKKIYDEFWDKMVPKWGMPNFIYNEPVAEQKSNKFPYKGTMVRLMGENVPFRYGITDEVQFEKKIVKVKEKPNSIPIDVDYKKVRRLTLAETDGLFYYLPGNDFKCLIDKETVIGTLSAITWRNKEAFFRLKGKEESVWVAVDKVARIL